MDLPKLEAIIKKSWCHETSSDPDHWTPENPSWGQCAVTACVVNDYLGGEVIWAEAVLPDGRKISHYFNDVNEEEIDLTRIQFPKGTTIPKGVEKKKGFPTTRAYILSYQLEDGSQPTRERYERLKQKVQENLDV